MTASIMALTAGTSAAAQTAGELYYGFTLIDPATKQRVENAYIDVKDGLIVGVGTGRPASQYPAARTHNLAGKFVLPGFIDAHAHITTSGIVKTEIKDGQPMHALESVDRVTALHARIALARGVTMVRDPGGDPVANAHYDQMISSGQWIGPEARHAGAVIQPPPMGGTEFAYPRTDAEWDAEAAKQAALGMRYFKLYTGLSADEIAKGIQAAHRHGLKAIAHLNEVSWQRAIDLGIDGLEHALPTSPDMLEPGKRGQFVSRPDSTFMYRWFELADYDGPLIEKLIRSLAERKIPVDLTLTVNERLYNVDRLESLVPAIEMEDMDPEVRRNYVPQLKAGSAGWTPEDFQRARAVMPKVLDFARRLHAAGVPMMIGTDVGGGSFYAQELELHVKAGIPVWDVLQMATSETADVMGVGDRIGRISKGFEADLVILEGDPTIDIKAAGKVFGVVNNGALLPASELRKQPN